MDSETLKSTVENASIGKTRKKRKQSVSDKNSKSQKSHGIQSVSMEVYGSRDVSNIHDGKINKRNEDLIFSDDRQAEYLKTYIPENITEQHKKGTKPNLWSQNFNELVKFQSIHGHCRVPGKYLTNPKLGYHTK